MTDKRCRPQRDGWVLAAALALGLAACQTPRADAVDSRADDTPSPIDVLPHPDAGTAAGGSTPSGDAARVSQTPSSGVQLDLTVLPNLWGTTAVTSNGSVLLYRWLEAGAMAVSEIGVDGSERWSLGLPQLSSPGVLQVDADRFLLFGGFTNKLTLGSLSVSSTRNPAAQVLSADVRVDSRDRSAPSLDGVLALLNTYGATEWIQTFAGFGSQAVNAAALSGDEIVVAGPFVADLNVADHGVRSRFGAVEGQSFLARLDQSGQVLALSAFDGIRPDYLAACSNGDVAVSGYLSSDDQGSQLFLSRFNRAGEVVWSHSWNERGASVGGIACDGSGAVYATVAAGDLHDDQLFMGELLNGEGALVVFDREGDATWLSRFSGVRFAPAIAVKDDRIGVTGSFEDSTTFGSDSLVSAGLRDFFLAEFSLDGTLSFSATIGGSENDNGVALYPTPRGWLVDFYVGTDVLLGSPTTTVPEGEHLMWVDVNER